MNEHASIHYNFTQDHLKLITNPFENWKMRDAVIFIILRKKIVFWIEKRGELLNDTPFHDSDYQSTEDWRNMERTPPTPTGVDSFSFHSSETTATYKYIHMLQQNEPFNFNCQAIAHFIFHPTPFPFTFLFFSALE